MKQNNIFLEFEKSISVLEGHVYELRQSANINNVNVTEELSRLQARIDRELQVMYLDLSPWEKTLVARHVARPHAIDYINNMIDDFQELSGDRNFADDEALIGGIGKFEDIPVVVIGNEKGGDTESRIKRNFGMAKPEGYRKAQRLMKLADHFNLPVITFVDTAGAFPGKDAEERGQAQAIANSIKTCLNLKTPIISVIIGEGGSGGAIALATANRVLMLEHSIYSVISPEGCASILWHSSDMNKVAAKALKLTAKDLLELKVIDEIIPEPIGGAHRHTEEAIYNTRKAIGIHLDELMRIERGVLKQNRWDKYLAMGCVS